MLKQLQDIDGVLFVQDNGVGVKEGGMLGVTLTSGSLSIMIIILTASLFVADDVVRRVFESRHSRDSRRAATNRAIWYWLQEWLHATRRRCDCVFKARNKRREGCKIRTLFDSAALPELSQAFKRRRGFHVQPLESFP